MICYAFPLERWGTEIEELRESARDMKYDYIAITDHSKSLTISGGLNEERLSAQGLVIDALNRQCQDFTIFKGIEVDILKEGQLDFADEVLASLDIVVASIHSYFNLDREEQTERILRAIRNKYVNIIGHLTGRLLNRRPGYEVDIDRIMMAAHKHQVELEINSTASLDIEWLSWPESQRIWWWKIAINQ